MATAYSGSLLVVDDDKHIRSAMADYLRSLAKKAKERSERTHLSLNEATRKTEKEQDDAWRLELENGLRKIQGKPALASLDPCY